MSNATEERKAEEQELKEMEEQLTRSAEEEKAKAEETPPSPEPAESPATEVPPSSQEADVTPNASEVEKPKDNPMEWAKKKGFKSPEDMARALLQKEQEYHASRQKKEEPIPQWQPRPDFGQNGYLPPPQYIPSPMPQMPQENFRQISQMYGWDPEDARRLMPAFMDFQAMTERKILDAVEKRFSRVEQTTARQSELMSLMQDPAFRDTNVQKEIHAVLDSDPSIFQRERQPLVYAYERAVINMYRKQLQQGENNGQRTAPPVTAGGGNGSAYTGPRKITEREFESWTPKQMEAFINSNGKIVPK